MVLPTLQDLKLQGITLSNGESTTLVEFFMLSLALALWRSHRVSAYDCKSVDNGFNHQWDSPSGDCCTIFRYIGNNGLVGVKFRSVDSHDFAYFKSNECVLPVGYV